MDCPCRSVICMFVLASLKLAKAHEVQDSVKLILVSFDGFRWDYLNNISKEDVPNFNLLKENGAWAMEGLKNAFITKTLPNHFTLVTGLYEESHGLVGNTFYDPNLKEVFAIGNVSQFVDPKWFNTGAEPIWVTYQKSSERHRSGSVMWPGDGAPIKNYLPSRYILFDRNMTFRTRVDVLISWFLAEDPISLGLLYCDEPDRTGHQFGPNSPTLVEKVKEMDKVLGHLIMRLKEAKLWDTMNLIVTSDHGMTGTPADKMINLDKYVNASLYRMFTTSPVADVLPNEGVSVEDLYEKFKEAERHEHLKVYKKKEIPVEYHYSDNSRIMPIVLEAEPHYSLSHNNRPDYIKGNHGYNNSFSDMHPIFMAIGPAFREKTTVKTFNNVDIYPMICYILGIEPAPNNGSLEHVSALLKPREEFEEIGGITVAYFFLIPMVLCLAAILSVAACRQRRFQQWRPKRVPVGAIGYPVDNHHTSLMSESEDDFLGFP